MLTGRDVDAAEAARIGLDAASLETHMRHEGIAQLYARNLTGNFEEMIQARKEHRTPVYLGDTREKDV
jgi:enoyl-CoA hydratase/carnithine racemase